MRKTFVFLAIVLNPVWTQMAFSQTADDALPSSASLAETRAWLTSSLERLSKISYVDGGYDVYRRISEIEFKGCAIKFRHTVTRTPTLTVTGLSAPFRSVFYVFDFSALDPTRVSTQLFKKQGIGSIILNTKNDRRSVYIRTAPGDPRSRDERHAKVQIEVKVGSTDKVEAGLRRMIVLCTDGSR
jgi:hypothetical protein